jgi:hypothetical protein
MMMGNFRERRHAYLASRHGIVGAESIGGTSGVSF